MIRKRIAALLGAAVLTTGIATLAGTTPAKAVDGSIGICFSLETNQCWRLNGSAIDLWARDISGDVNQQFYVYYLYQSTSSNCPEHYSPSYGVYSFETVSTGEFVGASYYSGGYYWVGEQENPNNYSLWAWAPNGELFNCGNGYELTDPSDVDYTQLVAASSGGFPWEQIDPSPMFPARGPADARIGAEEG